MDTEQKIKELLNNTNAYDYTKKIYDKNKEKEIEEQLKIVRKKVENTIFEMIQNGEFTRTIKDLGKEWYSKTNDLIYELNNQYNIYGIQIKIVSNGDHFIKIEIHKFKEINIYIVNKDDLKITNKGNNITFDVSIILFGKVKILKTIKSNPVTSEFKNLLFNLSMYSNIHSENYYIFYNSDMAREIYKDLSNIKADECIVFEIKEDK